MKIILAIIYFAICVSSESIYETMLRRTALKIIDKSVGDKPCGADLRLFVEGLEQTKTWALEMLDASEKLQSGIMKGNIRVSGNYDECMAINTIYNESHIQGKYCLFGIFPNVSKVESMLDFQQQLNRKGIKTEHIQQYVNQIFAMSAICIPKTCTTKDLSDIWNYTKYMFTVDLELKFDEKYCDYEGRVQFNKLDIITIMGGLVFTAILLISTAYDIISYNRNKEFSENIWTSFSFVSNGIKLFTINSKENELSCLYGIRVISMMWIILCHAYLINIFIPLINGMDFFEWKNKIENMIILGGTVSVDTFFVLSGLVVVYVYLCSQEEGIKFSLPVFYLHRFLRLTPSLAAILLSLVTLFRYLGDGPYWHIIYEIWEETCEKYWWTTLLYIQNTYSPIDQCLPHGWYLSVDTQMYMLSPILLYCISKWPKKTVFTVLNLIFLSMIAGFVITWSKKLGAMPYEMDTTYLKYIYQATYIRGSAWLLGALLGYSLFHLKNSEVPIPQRANFLLWFISLGVMAAIVFGQVTFTKYDYDVLRSSLFNALARPAWSICLCYIIFSCVKGHGGYMNLFLSHPVFQILSRLTYSMYLMHLGVLGIVINGRRTVQYFSNIIILHDFWGYFVYTVLYSVIWTLMFESPVISIERILFRRGKSTTNKGKNVNQLNMNENLASIDILTVTSSKNNTKEQR